LTIQTLNEQWSSDHWLHQVVLHVLDDGLGDPPPLGPLVGLDVEDQYYSPYMMGLALLREIAGIGVIPLLQIAGIANLVLLLAAFWLFVGRLVDDRRVVPWALLATLVCWGPDTWRWSGMLNLNSLGFGLHYPSCFATGCALLAGWLLLRWADERRPWQLVALAGLAALVVLTHPLTGGWMAVMLLVLATSRRVALHPALLAAGGAAVLLAVAWPPYSLLDLVGAGDVYEGGHETFYEDLPLRLAATLPGLVVLVRRWRRDHLDALPLLFLAALAVYATGFVLDQPNLGRVVPLLVLPLHIGIGELLVGAWARAGDRSRPALAAVGAAFVVGTVGVLPALPRMVPRPLLPTALGDDVEPMTARYEGLEGAIEEGAVVVAEDANLRRVASLEGAVPPDPATPFERELFTLAIPPAERSARARSRGVELVLCAGEGCARTFAGTRAFANDDVVVVDIAS
jgi:hypothetical protein